MHNYALLLLWPPTAHAVGYHRRTAGLRASHSLTLWTNKWPPLVCIGCVGVHIKNLMPAGPDPHAHTWTKREPTFFASSDIP